MTILTLRGLIASACAACAALSCPPARSQLPQSPQLSQLSQPRTGRLIVVADKGGSTAQPYYEAIDLVADKAGPRAAPAPQGDARPRAGSESDMLPVRSPSLSPGKVSRRMVQAPGLRPIFLIGDDDLSKAWLRARLPFLSQIKAAGFVVDVSTAPALQALRQMAGGLELVPASGVDLAQRMQITHYPVLITSSSIEQ
jgi:integrating conjugative element protein (TIGR03765 family)